MTSQDSRPQATGPKRCSPEHVRGPNELRVWSPLYESATRDLELFLTSQDSRPQARKLYTTPSSHIQLLSYIQPKQTTWAKGASRRTHSGSWLRSARRYTSRNWACGRSAMNNRVCSLEE